jgi:hypothetical protein
MVSSVSERPRRWTATKGIATTKATKLNYTSAAGNSAPLTEG